MLQSDLVRRAAASLQDTRGQDVAQATKEQIQVMPTLSGKQGVYKDNVIQRIIDIHDKIIRGEQINESDAGFLVLTHFNAVAEIQKLQAVVDKLAAEFYRQSIGRVSLAGRA